MRRTAKPLEKPPEILCSEYRSIPNGPVAFKIARMHFRPAKGGSGMHSQGYIKEALSRVDVQPISFEGRDGLLYGSSSKLNQTLEPRSSVPLLMCHPMRGRRPAIRYQGD